MIPVRKTRILFVCIGNMCRSPMAEGFARTLGGDVLEIYSAGTNPTGFVSEDAIEIMRELKIDISAQRSGGLDAVPVADMDIVVSMAPLPARRMVPRGFGGVAIDWKVQDPVGKSLTVFRRVRDDIHVRVTDLVDQVRRGELANRRTP
ncbi:MAG: arsenate reductase ArsC [Candidatus Krumholzibacteria bacterium]|nr:arsenate reductase ArsC [Candidatus Krumholzibacteria bacterium]MDH4337949.1 arsenate reductase ArsC [Candidatus Krumholzibacteria bacterium]MDH5270305.1 arsenate reductase ArsC [Candidatus Krumholzibacteria bacterium]MDH5627675.1 arsenate reductase ArsC [Candidatus Krumholzibacteria bacterium]